MPGMKNYARRSAQSGQSIVIIALAMVAILAFVVLAVDGGKFYSQRRVTQNAADMASLAAVYKYSTNASIKGQVLLTEIDRVAQLNGIADTNGNPADAINTNVTAWWANSTGSTITLLGTINNDASQAPPSGTNAIKVQTMIPYPTFIGGLVGQASLVAQSDAVALYVLTKVPTNDDSSSIYLGGSDCDNLTDKIGANYSNTNTAHFTSSFYIDGSLAVGSVNGTDFDGNVTVRAITGTSPGNKADGPYNSVNPTTKMPFSNNNSWNTINGVTAQYIPPSSPAAAAKGFPAKWAYVTVNGTKTFLDASAFQPGTGAYYQWYSAQYAKGTLASWGNIPPDTFFNTIPVGASPTGTITNINAAFNAGQRGIFWVDGDIIVPAGTPYWPGVTLVTTGRFRSDDNNHQYGSAGPLARNISVLAGKDYGMPYRCASDYSKWAFYVDSQSNVFDGIIYVPYGQILFTGNASGGGSSSQLSKGIVAYSTYLGTATGGSGGGSANSWQFSFDPSAFVEITQSTQLQN